MWCRLPQVLLCSADATCNVYIKWVWGSEEGLCNYQTSLVGYYLKSCRHVTVKKAFSSGPFGESTRFLRAGQKMWVLVHMQVNTGAVCVKVNRNGLLSADRNKKACLTPNTFNILYFSRFLFLVVSSHMLTRGSRSFRVFMLCLGCHKCTLCPSKIETSPWALTLVVRKRLQCTMHQLDKREYW